ncbi:TIGR03086 family metal-binding protein [Actinokineospora xionganensis]|uniref:TIGR03086 family protein n=1 Tax=Actinokineospora xionganensis TaxID=2684470 RepID=A0ABR7L0U2_9PSEU|nr:TIGR03086 family metal-binding protein [Actinokineospora xionganensis]MBC6446138.1 TIGR03086 family protein [Actinokineospora xionganensis]
MNLAELHRRSCERFGEHLRAVRHDQWTAPTPCADWDVRGLVNHVTGEDLWTGPLMAGATIGEVGDRFDGDVLGSDPVAAYTDAAESAVDAVSADGALGRTVHLSFGDVPGEEYAWQLFADHLIHGWDLARAIGADDRLDPDLVAACAQWFAKNEDGYREAGAVGARPEVPADADQQTLLLAGFGRRP